MLWLTGDPGIGKSAFVDAARPGALPTPALTGQEANIVTAVAQGRSTREVAELLVLSPRTVETHLSSVYRKLASPVAQAWRKLWRSVATEQRTRPAGPR